MAPFDSKTMDFSLLEMESNSGLSMVNPSYALQQVMYNFLGSNTESTVSSATEVVVKIYLMKGVHHYISCTDVDDVDWTPLESRIYYNSLAVMCL